MALRRGRGRSSGDRERPRTRKSKRDSGGRKGRFKYQSRGADSYRNRANQQGGDRDSFVSSEVKTYTVREGANHIRIMPPTWEDPEHYGFDHFVNYSIGADNNQYLSLSKMYGEDDPIAEERKKAMDDGDDDYANSLKWKKRCGVWLIDRKDEEAGPQFYSMAWTLDRDISAAASDEDSREVLDIDDPENGYDVKFTGEKFSAGKGTGLKPIGVKIVRNSSPLSEDDDQMDEWLDYIQDNPVPSVLVKHSYEHIEKALTGSKKHSDEDEEEEERHSRRRGRRDEEEEEEDNDLSWEEVHELSYRELKKLIKDEDLDIDPEDFDDDEELADFICEEMGIEEEKKRGRGRSRRDEEEEEEDDDRGRKRMRRMRR